MFQNINGRRFYVIAITTQNPKTLLPIRTNAPSPAAVANGLMFTTSLGLPMTDHMRPYAEALDEAIRREIVTGPGKYAIEVNAAEKTWNIYAVNE